MNDALLKQIANEQMPIYTALKGFVNSINYINIGVISKVHDENYVDVNLYYKDNTGKNVAIQAVRLLHIGTTKCKLSITPAVGDNVLLICPKDFIETLEYNRTPEKCESSFLPYGDINMCGILIREEGTDNVKTTININENGDVSLTTEGNISASSAKTISFDGDKFGGLCKTQELKTQLDKATARIDGIIDALEKSATGSQDGGAAYKANITLALELLTDKEDYSNIESDKVLHGDNSGD
jgi:hypothetical protein